MKCWFILGVALFFASGGAAAKLLDVKTFELDNGLQAAVIENHKAPVALLQVYYKAGSLYDPVGKGGIAHLLEHLMFRGTKKLPDKAFNRLTEEHGAENNAYTTYAETAYYEFTDVGKLELMLAIEADRMAGLVISDEAFATERDIVLQERRQRYETNPVPLFYESLNSLLWQDGAMANPVSGKPKEILNLSKADAEEFYRRYYRPDNALVIIAGDVGFDEAKVLVKKYFGKLSGKGELSKPVLETNRAAVSALDMRLKGVTHPRYADYIRLLPGELSKKDELALALFSEYLAGDDTAYLYEKLVYGDAVLLSVGTEFSYDPAFGGSFAFYAVPNDEAMKREEISRVLAAAVESGIGALTTEELLKIKNEVLSATVYLQENPLTSAHFAGNLLMRGLSADEIVGYDEAIGRVSVDDVRLAWQKVLAAAKKARVTGYLLGSEDAAEGSNGDEI